MSFELRRSSLTEINVNVKPLESDYMDVKSVG